MTVDLEQIQTNVLRSVDPSFSFYAFFRISDTQTFRSFLAAALAQGLTFAGTPTGFYSERQRLRSRSIEATAEPSPQSHSLHMNVGFTMSGLERLEVNQETCDSFPEPFREGMAVHGRYGQPCPRCGAKIQRIRYASNETNYCAVCQTGGKLLADRALSRLLGQDWPRTLEELEERRASR